MAILLDAYQFFLDASPGSQGFCKGYCNVSDEGSGFGMEELRLRLVFRVKGLGLGVRCLVFCSPGLPGLPDMLELLLEETTVKFTHCNVVPIGSKNNLGDKHNTYNNIHSKTRITRIRAYSMLQKRLVHITVIVANVVSKKELETLNPKP